MSDTTKKRIAVVLFGASVNLLLFFVKLYIGLSSNSVAIYADSLNSMTDCAVCIAAVIGFCIGSAKNTEDYPFGKGRAEELTELLISAVILVSGGVFAYISFERILYPVPVWYSSVYAVIIAATAAVKFVLSFVFAKSAKKLGSGAIKGIAADSGLDFFITLCTLISFTLSSKTDFSVDGIAGVIVGIILIAEGVKSARLSLVKVLGKKNSEICDKAKMLIESDASVKAVEEIRYHSYGESGVFNADIKTDCTTAEEIENLSVRINKTMKENFDSEIYFNFGGRDEN
ncbi:MAG: cation diffusion facilitator family transporter [Clostridia bacterium]|nr:cation diffusion facilitator family transporter [Clostridia bacterium]MBQ4603150.1 cation diffusion facilitator family transporter [Clostridia bacterium]